MYTMKKDLIFNYSMLPSMDELKNNELILVTAGGVIKGKPISENPETFSTNVLDKITHKMIIDYREAIKIPEATRLDGNDGCLLLENATLINGTTKIPFQYLVVFFDQIIAVTIGSDTTN